MPLFPAKTTSDWVAYTPTCVGWGTVSGLSAFSRRVGDSLEVQFKVTTGTVTAVTATVSLGFNGTNGNVSLDTAKVPTVSIVGHGGGAPAGPLPYAVITDNTTPTVVNFSFSTGGAGLLTAQTGSAAFANSTAYSFTFTVPISGWSA